MAARVPNANDISAMLASLLEIVQKYQDNDPENPPGEGDYLLACNTLKAINDRRHLIAPSGPPQVVTQYQYQTVIQIRERIRRIPNLLEVTQRHAGWMLKKLNSYVCCDICGSQLKDEYAVNRHKKRGACRTEKARLFFFTPAFKAKVERWAKRGFHIDFPFVV